MLTSSKRTRFPNCRVTLLTLSIVIEFCREGTMLSRFTHRIKLLRIKSVKFLIINKLQKRHGLICFHIQLSQGFREICALRSYFKFRNPFATSFVAPIHSWRHGSKIIGGSHQRHLHALFHLVGLRGLSNDLLPASKHYRSEE